MIARLAWLAAGIAVGVLGGRATARRGPDQAPPVLASATRVPLEPAPTGTPEPPADPPQAPATEATPAPAAPAVDEAPAPPRPRPSPRPRSEPSGRHAWVPPEDAGPA